MSDFLHYEEGCIKKSHILSVRIEREVYIFVEYKTRSVAGVSTVCIKECSSQKEAKEYLLSIIPELEN